MQHEWASKFHKIIYIPIFFQMMIDELTERKDIIPHIPI